MAKFPVGEMQGGLEITYTDGGNKVAEGGYRVLNQPYSIVFGYRFDSDAGGKFARAADDTLDWVQVRTYGYANPTSLSTLATTVGPSATYAGNAFYGMSAATGALSYTVNFANSTGLGTITNLPTELGLATVTLKEASLGTTGFGTGDVDASVSGQSVTNIGKYEVSLFGPNAEELAGRVYNYDEDYDELDHIGFSGKR